MRHKPDRNQRGAREEAPRASDGLFIWGRHPVVLALGRAECFPRSLFVRAGANGLDTITDAARNRAVAIHILKPEDMDRRFEGINHQGVLLEMGGLPEQAPEGDIIDPEAKSGLVLALDEITDPQNLGAIFRVALFFGARGVVYPKRRSAGLTGAVVKAGAGAPLVLPHLEVTNLVEFLRRAKSANYWIYGADSGAGKAPWDLDLTGRVVLVLGSESDGLRRLVKETCDELVSLPGGNFESLNVLTAAAAVCADILRQNHIRHAKA